MFCYTNLVNWFQVTRLSRKNVCFVMFTDEVTLQTLSSEGQVPDGMGFIGFWKLVVVKNLPYDDMRRVGKIPKLLPHRLFPSARWDRVENLMIICIVSIDYQDSHLRMLCNIVILVASHHLFSIKRKSAVEKVLHHMRNIITTLYCFTKTICKLSQSVLVILSVVWGGTF